MDTAVKYGPCLLALQKKRIKFFETKCMRKLLRISYLEHKTNDWVRSQISFLVGPQEPLLATVKRRKLARSGHVTRHDSLSKTIPQGTLEDGRRRGQKRKCWMDDIKEWTSLPMPNLLTRAFCRKDWKRSLLNRTSCPPDDPIGQGTELNWTELNSASKQSVS